MKKTLRRAAPLRLMLAVALIAPATVRCGKSKAPAEAGGPKTAVPAKSDGPMLLDPVAAKAADLKPGLKLTTFPNNTFSGNSESSIVPVLAFDCDRNPYHNKEVSLRYEGYLKVETAGEYCFQTASDDQSTFSLNKKPVIVQAQAGTTKERRVTLKEGFYEIGVDYQNNVGPACLRINWSKSGCAGYAEIPASLLFH